MAEYLIQGETLKDIADAIRAKTGERDVIPVKDMATQISGITGGGGEDIFSVTFMREDGTGIPLREKYVINRNTVGDPVNLGEIEKPTKANTLHKEFAFGGWSKVPPKEDMASDETNVPDPLALIDVTENRTVYAAFDVTCYGISTRTVTTEYNEYYGCYISPALFSFALSQSALDTIPPFANKNYKVTVNGKNYTLYCADFKNSYSGSITLSLYKGFGNGALIKNLGNETIISTTSTSTNLDFCLLGLQNFSTWKMDYVLVTKNPGTYTIRVAEI
jgi:hypothetical protein